VVSPFVAPPVAGYEVLLDGEAAGQVGSTRITLPAPPPGPHTYGVRTVNAVGQVSAPAGLAHP
jgi:hypothetical protein